jgi:hypothetical protein
MLRATYIPTFGIDTLNIKAWNFKQGMRSPREVLA